jgi:aminoglycoside phosphotransferase (APT) family kinase protein
VFLPHLANAVWATGVVTRHATNLAILGAIATVRLLDARLTHPHRPDSPMARGWATYAVAMSDSSSEQLYVKGFPDAALAEAAAKQDPRATWLRDEDLVVWRFPDDPLLPALPTLVDPRTVAEALSPPVREVIGADARPQTTVVRYQPEASATLRLEEEAGAAVFAKHLAYGDVAGLDARHRALWSHAEESEHLRVAEPLAVDEDRSVLWARGVPGAPLTSAVPPSRLPEVAGSVGALLAELHESPVDVPQRLTVDELLVEVRKKADKLSRAHPPVQRLLSDIVAAAESRRDQVTSQRERPLHGDFHLDQLVASPHGPVLVDLDSMVTGAPEVDLAEFLVDLALRGLPESVVHRVARALLASYVDVSGTDLDPALLAICADAEFVNRCYRTLRHHAPGWQLALERELSRHEAVRTVSHLVR